MCNALRIAASPSVLCLAPVIRRRSYFVAGQAPLTDEIGKPRPQLEPQVASLGKCRVD